MSDLAGEALADARTGKNGRHALVGMLRQSVFGRLAGYEDVNDAERLRHDPALRWIIGGKAAKGRAASSSQMGRFETRWLAASENLCALSELPGGEKLIKIGAKVVSHGRYIAFQMAEVAISRHLFGDGDMNVPAEHRGANPRDSCLLWALQCGFSPQTGR